LFFSNPLSHKQIQTDNRQQTDRKLDKLTTSFELNLFFVMSGNQKGSNPPPTTSQKHRNFVSEPMGKRSVRDVPGIGAAQGRRLEESSVARADQLLGQYLVNGRDQGQFKNYLKETAGANTKHQRDAYNGIKEWTENNM
ncbi:hypothetical protein DPEC_G00230530, partial [Dallia pectoralis]